MIPIYLELFSLISACLFVKNFWPKAINSQFSKHQNSPENMCRPSWSRENFTLPLKKVFFRHFHAQFSRFRYTSIIITVQINRKIPFDKIWSRNLSIYEGFLFVSHHDAHYIAGAGELTVEWTERRCHTLMRNLTIIVKVTIDKSVVSNLVCLQVYYFCCLKLPAPFMVQNKNLPTPLLVMEISWVQQVIYFIMFLVE